MTDDWNTFTKWLSHRLKTIPLPGFNAQKTMMPVGRPHPDPPPLNARRCAVLLLLYPNLQNNDIELVLIQRSEDGGAHSGQIAFPGGKVEPFDRSLEDTALREAREEVALDTAGLTLQGRLSSIYIPVSNFVVYPVLATTEQAPDLRPSDLEVAAILYFSFRQTFPNKKTISLKLSSRLPRRLPDPVPAYLLSDDKIIWGATAMILSELDYIWNEYAMAADSSRTSVSGNDERPPQTADGTAADTR